MNKFIIFFLILSAPSLVWSTPQHPERLIYNGDTIWIDSFPLEDLRENNLKVQTALDSLCPWQISTRWRGYTGTWQIINDSLFLTKIEGDKTEKIVSLDKIFNKSYIGIKGVFASWYTQSIIANYGKLLGLDYDILKPIFTGEFHCKINAGIVSDVEIKFKSKEEISYLEKRFQAEEDTAVCLVVSEYPKLITNERIYDYSELEEYISTQINPSKFNIDCNQRVTLYITVEKNGTVSKIENLRHTNNTKCEKEAIRIVKLMKQWTPGSLDGRIVRTKFPIPFWIEKE